MIVKQTHVSASPQQKNKHFSEGIRFFSTYKQWPPFFLGGEVGGLSSWSFTCGGIGNH